jgi:hypothetical protein
MRKGVQIGPAPWARKNPSGLLDSTLLRQQEELESKARRHLLKGIYANTIAVESAQVTFKFRATPRHTLHFMRRAASVLDRFR